MNKIPSLRLSKKSGVNRTFSALRQCLCGDIAEMDYLLGLSVYLIPAFSKDSHQKGRP